MRLFGRSVGSPSEAVTLGTTIADSVGNWQITSSPLANGTYAFSAASFRADGQSTGTVEDGSLTIDTVAPIVVDELFQAIKEDAGEEDTHYGSPYGRMREVIVGILLDHYSNGGQPHD